jgi:hypothetical protein
VSRIFMSHSSLDNRAALALRQWLIDQDRSLKNEIFLDLHPEAGIRPGEPERQAVEAVGGTGHPFGSGVSRPSTIRRRLTSGLAAVKVDGLRH